MSDARWDQIKSLFAAALDRPVGERAAFLDQSCGDDAELRREVESLLQARTQGVVRTGGAAEALASASTSSHIAAPLTERAGSVIGPYKLLQQIGEGGFGTVFMAEQSQPVRRRVALKIIKLGMDTKSVIARFEAERQALALMDHPHIARVLDAGATDTGRPYFVMEYVTGDAITAFCDAHTLDVRQRLELFSQVCQAVQHAHTKGLIHRDIKPGNVLVSMTDGKPFAKVIDFGIAKATAAPLTDKTLFTEHRQLIGTPEYMSPEQAQGSADIDTRTDVYALGVLLYELLTGLTPFDGKRLRSAAYAEMQRIIKEEDPPAPSIRLPRDQAQLLTTATARQSDPHRLTTQIKGELDWIVMKALDKDRARRYESPNQFAADVQRHLAGEAVVAAPPSAGYRVRKFVKKNRGPVLVTSAVMLALLAGGSVAAWQWKRAEGMNSTLLAQKSRAQQGVGEMMSILTDGVTKGPISSTSADGGPTDPLDLSIGMGVQLAHSLKEERENLRHQTDTAEWSAYTANLALAQSAMDAGNWPEARERLAACAEAKRGWEWQFLSRKANSVVAQFPSAYAVSPDGQAILSSTGNTVRVYDPEGKPLGPPLVHDAEVISCDFAATAETRLVITASADRRVHVWTLGGQRPFQRVQLNCVPSVNKLSPDGSTLLTLSHKCDTAQDLPVQLWNSSGQSVATLSVPGCDMLDADFSPNGQLIMTRSSDNSVRLWDARGAPVGSAMMHPSHVRSAQFAPDGTRLLTVCGDGAARLWDLGGRSIGSEMRNTREANVASFSADSKRVLTESHDGTLRIWDPEAKPVSGTLAHFPGVWQASATSAKVLSDGETVLRAPDRHSACLTSLEGVAIGARMWAASGIYGITLSPDQSMLASVAWSFSEGDCCVLQVWDPMRGLVAEVSTGRLSIEAVQFTDDAKYLLAWESNAADSYGPLVVRPARPACPDRTILDDGFRDFELDAILHPDGPDPTTSISHTVAVTPPESIASTAACSIWLPDATRFITGGDDGSIRFWNPDGWREVASIRLGASVTRIDLSPSADRLVARLADGTARVWDTRPPEAQARDYERRIAESAAADQYVESLWNGSTPTGELQEPLKSDASLTSIRRLVAMMQLQQRLQDLDRDANSAFTALTKGQTDKAAVLAAARTADAPPRLKEKLLAMAERWTYSPPQPSMEQRLASETRQRRLADASLVLAQALSTDTPNRDIDLEALRAAAATRAELLGEQDADTAKAHWVFGIIAFARGLEVEGIQSMHQAVDTYSAVKTPPDDVLVGMYVNLAQAELWAGHVEVSTGLLHGLVQTIEDDAKRPSPGIQFEFRCDFAYQPGFHGRRTINLSAIRGPNEPLSDCRDRVLSELRNMLTSGLRPPSGN